MRKVRFLCLFRYSIFGLSALLRSNELARGGHVEPVPLPQTKTSSLLFYLALWQATHGTNVDRITLAAAQFNEKALNLNVEVKRLRRWLHERAGLDAETSEQIYVANADNQKSGLLQLSEYCVIDYVKFREALVEARSTPSFRTLALLQRWYELVSMQAFFAPQSYLGKAEEIVKQACDAFERDRDEAQRLLKAAKSRFDPEMPPHNPYFGGRTDSLKTLQTAFISRGTTLIVGQAIAGMGGVGKTTLAVEYARKYSLRYTYLFFVRAETRDTIRAKYEEIAAWFGLHQTHPSFSGRPISEADSGVRTVQVVKDWLTYRQDYLLILDNVEDPSLLRTFLPASPGGHILITMRSRSVGTHAGPPVLLECFSPERACDFLVQRLGLSWDVERRRVLPSLQRIAGLVGGLPLALTLAADAILGDQRNIPGYVAELEENISVLERDTPGANPEETVSKSLHATFLIPFRKVPPSVQELLILLAFLAPEPVQEEWLLAHPALLGPHLGSAVERRESLCQWLNLYSLCDCSQGAFQLHRLVHALIRQTLSPEEQTLWLRRAVSWLRACLPDCTASRASYAALLTHVRFVSEQLKTNPWDDECAASLLHEIAIYQIGAAELDDAEESSLRAYEIRKRIHPSGTPEILYSVSLLAECYSRRSNRIQFGAYAEAAWEEAKRSLPPGHPHWATIYEHICFWRMYQDDFEVAAEFGQLALEHAQGEKITTQWRNLGVLHIKNGRWAEAQCCFEQALQLTETRPGFEGERTALALAVLGEIYARLGQFDLAQQAGERAISIMERLHGRTHPMVATALLYHSHYRSLAGDYAGAEELVRQAAAIRYAYHGENSADHVDTLVYQTVLVLRQGRLEEARRLLDRLHGIAQVEASGFAANAWVGLVSAEAQWRYLNGDFDGAEQGFLEALDRHQAQHIGLAPQAPEYLYWLGRCTVQRGNIPLAKERFEKALHLLQQHPTPDAALVASLQSELDALN